MADAREMAQKLRKPSKEAGYEYLTVMVPSELRAKLLAEAKAEDRTLSDVARRRLLGADDRLSPRARAIGRLVAMLFNNLAQSSRPEQTTAMLTVGVPALLDHLGSAAKLEDQEKAQAKNFAEYLWLRLSNAHVPAFDSSTPIPPTDEQRDLLEIQSILLPAEAPSSLARKPRKE
jgi:hypothetical protein